MLSIKAVFPAPVGPVIPNRSRLEKSISVRSRKLIKPSSSSRVGRMIHLIVEMRERAHQLLGRRRLFDRVIELAKMIGRGNDRARFGRRRGLGFEGSDPDFDRVGKQAAN